MNSHAPIRSSEPIPLWLKPPLHPTVPYCSCIAANNSEIIRWMAETFCDCCDKQQNDQNESSRRSRIGSEIWRLLTRNGGSIVTEYRVLEKVVPAKNDELQEFSLSICLTVCVLACLFLCASFVAFPAICATLRWTGTRYVDSLHYLTFLPLWY